MWEKFITTLPFINYNFLQKLLYVAQNFTIREYYQQNFSQPNEIFAGEFYNL